MYFLLRFISCIVDTILCLFLLKYVIDFTIPLFKKVMLLTVFCSSIGAFIDVLIGGNSGTMPVIVLFPFIIYFIYGTGSALRKIGQYVLVFLLYTSLSLFSVFVEMLVFEFAFTTAETNTRYTIIAIILNLLVITGIWNYCEKRKLHIKFTVREWILLFAVNVVTFLLLTALRRFGGLLLAQNVWEQLLILILNYSVLFFYIFFILFLASGKIASHFKEINILNERHMAEQILYFKSYKQMQEETRIYRHDMKNHFLYLQALCNNDKFEEVKQYIQNLNEKWNELSQLYVTGNESLDIIINVKQFLLEENDIQFILDGTFTFPLNLKPIDISTIFSNALDNAIEANMKVPNHKNRYIKFTIKSSEHHYLVQIENPVVSTVAISNNQISTDKGNTEHHGYGLLNIERTLKHNHGYMKLSSVGNEFLMEVVLPR